VTLLTSTAVDVNAPSKAFNVTALHLAAKTGDMELIKVRVRVM
jgi:hypothetical protein